MARKQGKGRKTRSSRNRKRPNKKAEANTPLEAEGQDALDTTPSSLLDGAEGDAETEATERDKA
ncbi:hypothetical protein KIPB_015354, partial [Kipferlia bialata]|eukprot:g15354.t1